MIQQNEVSDYLKKAHAVATVNGVQPDMTTLRGRTKAKEVYVASGCDAAS